MPWINLENIDVSIFLKGDYVPPNYHAPLTRVDLRYLFPNREYEIALNLMNDTEIKNYFKDNKKGFQLSEDDDIDDWAFEKSAYMPGPGNRRPTNSVLRYLRNSSPFNAYVAKVGNYLSGITEFQKQKDLFEIGIPTPKPFLIDNGALLNFVNNIMDFLNKKLKSNSISTEEYKQATKLFDDLLNRKIELLHLKSFLKREIFDSTIGENEAAEALKDYLRGKNLQFASILWMEFKFSTSFEDLLYNILGGDRLDQETGTSEIYKEPTVLPRKDLTTKIPQLLNKMWSITTHNDLKGEHIRWDQTKNANRFILIGWGTSGGGTLEFVPQDLGVLLYDVTMFIIERSLFSKKFKHQINNPIALRIEKEILSELEDFWSGFLQNINPIILNSEIINATIKFLEPKQNIYVNDAITALKKL